MKSQIPPMVDFPLLPSSSLVPAAVAPSTQMKPISTRRTSFLFPVLILGSVCRYAVHGRLFENDADKKNGNWIYNFRAMLRWATVKFSAARRWKFLWRNHYCSQHRWKGWLAWWLQELSSFFPTASSRKPLLEKHKHLPQQRAIRIWNIKMSLDMNSKKIPFLVTAIILLFQRIPWPRLTANLKNE